ncbi:glycine-rich RNA-binding protein 7-like [Arachis stenosperma]|uniref:glycine-rich RNA-binding protein 7-like n=1 Tax=Arachis stenosperma TaxID=217475 RepID=UPI0025ABC897|nr:glycine-rich RNA-binding protein 7-like [Arachis stenosperma]
MNINKKVTNGQKWVRVAEPGKRKGWNRGEGDCGGVRRGGGARHRGGGGRGVLGLAREEEDSGREGGGCCWLKGMGGGEGGAAGWPAVEGGGCGWQWWRGWKKGRRKKRDGEGVVRRWRLGGGGVGVVACGKKRREGGEG